MDDYQRRKLERIAQFEKQKGKKLITCTACSGSGRYCGRNCGACDGTGKTRQD